MFINGARAISKDVDQLSSYTCQFRLCKKLVSTNGNTAEHEKLLTKRNKLCIFSNTGRSIFNVSRSTWGHHVIDLQLRHKHIVATLTPDSTETFKTWSTPQFHNKMDRLSYAFSHRLEFLGNAKSLDQNREEIVHIFSNSWAVTALVEQAILGTATTDKVQSKNSKKYSIKNI